MKTIFFLIVSAFIFITPAKAQTQQMDYLEVYKRIIQCQAGFKILAYYIDIYQATNQLIDKNKLDGRSKQAIEKLEADWQQLEQYSLPIKNVLLKSGVDINYFDGPYYTQQIIRITLKGVTSSNRNEYISGLMEFASACKDINTEIEKNLKKETP